MKKQNALESYLNEIIKKINNDNIDFYMLLTEAFEKAKNHSGKSYPLKWRDQKKNITDTSRMIIILLHLNEKLSVKSGGSFDFYASRLLLELLISFEIPYKIVSKTYNKQVGMLPNNLMICDKENTFQTIIVSEQKSVDQALKDTSEARNDRLKISPKQADKIISQVTIYKRNPDVIAETLIRAAGICEKCKRPAPFKRKKNNQPYLEVHHRIPLSEDGEDTVENTIALCPNCHREMHFGV
jgi:5-methylcytosine-specific restriction endonuclease McrA